MRCTAAEYAKIRDRSKAWVSEQISQGMPCTGGGRAGAEYQIETGAAIQWEVDRADQKARSAAVTQRDRVSAAQAARLEMANRKELRELIEAGEVREIALRAISFLAQDLNAVAQRVTTDETIQAKIDDELIRARAQFAEHLEALSGGSAGAAADGLQHPPKAPKVARRVGRRGKDPAGGNAGAGAVAK